jgi:hypothetical protein
MSLRVGREARDALGAFVEHHLGHRLASRRFLDEVGPLLGEDPPSPPGSAGRGSGAKPPT